MRTGIATLPLHGGSAPPWLFDRMTKLGREITIAIVSDFGSQEFLKRVSNPYWFQALGCVLGFDWHSSGITTTVCGALKLAIKDIADDLGLYVAGGKGKTSRKTPSEIEWVGERQGFDPSQLIYSSKMSAKVDNTALQDGFQLYHHSFFFTPEGRWVVVQQGMNPGIRAARRYHWFSDKVRDYVEEPHSGIATQKRVKPLDLTAKQSKSTKDVSVELVKEKPFKLFKDLKKLERLDLPKRHPVLREDYSDRRLQKVLYKVHEIGPKNFEKLLGIRGVGPKAIRALALVSELIYGTKPSWKDPARFSFAHGGKDGHPYPVNQRRLDKSIQILHNAIKKAKVGRTERLEALKRLSLFAQF